MSETNVKFIADVGKALTVRLGKDLQAIPIRWVEEVLPALPIESVPRCPNFVRGVVFVRGHVIAVLDAAERLGMKNHQRPDEPPIVCMRLGDRLIGIEFDEVLDLIDVGGIDTLDATSIGADGGFFAGVFEHEGQLVRLLNPEKLLDEHETASLAQVPL